MCSRHCSSERLPATGSSGRRVGSGAAGGAFGGSAGAAGCTGAAAGACAGAGSDGLLLHAATATATAIRLPRTTAKLRPRRTGRARDVDVARVIARILPDDDHVVTGHHDALVVAQ